MIARLLSLFLLLSAVASFTTPLSRGGIAKAPSKQQRFMFNADGDDKKEGTTAPPLQSVDEPVSALETTDAGKTTVRDMNTGETREVNWVDPAMSANTNPFDMNWYVHRNSRVETLLHGGIALNFLFTF